MKRRDKKRREDVKRAEREMMQSEEKGHRRLDEQQEGEDWVRFVDALDVDSLWATRCIDKQKRKQKRQRERREER